ncbi:hypothetical protein BBJ28_00020139 [Nothophytophthora sp. Chile5]|nr:hypothetical protein BBJ28_00020139 [Nothophytophthora sp. Chile5]
MLSRLNDVRVFESSEDVVFGAPSSSYWRQKQLQHVDAEQLEQEQPSRSHRSHGASVRSPASRSARSGSRRRVGSGENGENGVMDEEEAPEDEHLHPQHPYRMRKRVLNRESAASNGFQGVSLANQLVNGRTAVDQAMVAFRGDESRPMEFVFLPTGEIRPREDCPPGLSLPAVAQLPSSMTSNRRQFPDRAAARLEYHGDAVSEDGDESDEEGREEEDDYEEDEDGDDDECAVSEQRMSWKGTERSMRESRQTDSRHPVARQRREQFASSPSSSSQISSSGEANEGDEEFSSDDENDSVGPVSGTSSDDNEDEEDERETPKARDTRQRAPVTPPQRSNSPERVVVKLAKTNAPGNAKRTPNRSLKLAHLHGENVEGMPERAVKRTPSPHQTSIARKTGSKAAASERSSGRIKSRPAVLEQTSYAYRMEDTREVPISRIKRSPKMKVSHLLAEEPKAKAVGGAPSSARKETKAVERLELELQKEKKRVLDNMTQLLEEQSKNQQLHSRIEALEIQLTARDSEVSDRIKEATREQEERLQTLEGQRTDRVKVLEEKAKLNEATVLQLKHDKQQLKAALRKVKSSKGDQENGRYSSDQEAALKAQLDAMAGHIRDFLAKVDHWKANSKEAMECCDRKADLLALIEHMWLDFPRFPEVDAKQQKEKNSGPGTDQQQLSTGADEQANMVLFLKKRLRLREDELRQTHVKYVELKELCARQCVREADLQNFINEHRLRGTLIIRKKNGVKEHSTADNRAQNQEQHQRGTKTKTNTPLSYHEGDGGDEDDSNDEYSDNQEDNDEEEEGDDGNYPVRTPKIFVQVGRDGVYEHSPHANSAVVQKLASDQSRRRKKGPQQQQEVERIRLIPSPSLTQRYERVPTPTIAATRRKKSVQVSTLLPSSECPPGCGSRLPSRRKKAPSAPQQAKPLKRAVPAASSSTLRGPCGASRPWM